MIISKRVTQLQIPMVLRMAGMAIMGLHQAVTGMTNLGYGTTTVVQVIMMTLQDTGPTTHLITAVAIKQGV